jgi:hypothetical protein
VRLLAASTGSATAHLLQLLSQRCVRHLRRAQLPLNRAVTAAIRRPRGGTPPSRPFPSPPGLMLGGRRNGLLCILARSRLARDLSGLRSRSRGALQRNLSSLQRRRRRRSALLQRGRARAQPPFHRVDVRARLRRHGLPRLGPRALRPHSRHLAGSHNTLGA